VERRGGGRDGYELLRTRTNLSGGGSATTGCVHRGAHAASDRDRTVTNKEVWAWVRACFTLRTKEVFLFVHFSNFLTKGQSSRLSMNDDYGNTLLTLLT
jgi:hypothetical protein